MRFEKPLRVRFGHADPARIAYYPRFFEWFHDAFEDFFEVVSGQPYAELIASSGAGFPAVQVLTEFRRPARFGELLKLECFASRLGERSGVFEYRLRDGSGVLRAAASIKVAVLAIDSGGPRPWPPELRAALEPYLEDGEDPERHDPGRLRA